jgi:chromosome segregation ATPase
MTDSIKRIEMEARTWPRSAKTRYANEIQKCKASLQEHQLEFRRARNAGAARGREETAQRGRMMDVQHSLDAQERSLLESRRMVEESHARGQEVATNLRGQREQLENARDALDETDSTLDRTRKTLVRMFRFILIEF